MPAQAFRQRLFSRINAALVGWASPEFTIPASYSTAPGAVGRFLFVAPAPCKLVRVDSVADVNGAGASVIALRKHVAGQTAAANAAVSSTNIVALVASDIPADSTVRVPVLARPLVTTAGYTTFAAGDKLAIVTPATWVGNVTCYLIWL